MKQLIDSANYIVGGVGVAQTVAPPADNSAVLVNAIAGAILVVIQLWKTIKPLFKRK